MPDSTNKATPSFAESFKAAPRWQRVTLSVIFALGALGLAGLTWDKYQDRSQPVFSPEEAVQRMAGVWTMTEPIDRTKDTFPYEWIKWDIKSDGTMIACHAQPVDDNWGNCETTTAKPLSEKYSDTGERWYGLRQGDTVLVGIYDAEKDVIVLHHSPPYQTVATMRRGDVNPFSK